MLAKLTSTFWVILIYTLALFVYIVAINASDVHYVIHTRKPTAAHTYLGE
jgi:hypothetical protein